ncbi:MAG: peptidylprolyl isomerase [Myxococcales bacterium]|nr:peptidylprolyl isomerase [Myxococcales bacterium]MDH3483557.1 peptidylprolyl isomerase [Myxococcales bacterium]
MRRDFIVTWACLLWGFGVGCERPTNEALSAKVQTAVVTEVVATVGGHAIGAPDVRERVTLDGVSAKDALGALVEEELLIQEAQRTGLSEDPEAMRAVDRMIVRAFLRDLERENTPEGISNQQVRADFERHREQFQLLERRASWHVLVKADTVKARELAAGILDEARQADDPREVFERYAEGAADDLDVPVVVEELPPISIKADIEKPYKDKLFAAKTLGPLTEPVRTSYGWHAIVLTEIQPGAVRTLGDVEDEIRDRLSRKRRFEKLVEVVKRLEAEDRVVYNQAVVERLMSVRELPKRAE